MIVGKKVILRGFEERDIKRMVRWRNDPDINRHFFSYEPSTFDKQRRWLRASSSRHDEKFFVVSNRRGVAIGTVGLKEIDSRNRNAEWGRFMIGEREYQGRGYGREALRLSVEYAFSDLGLHRIYLKVFAWNRKARTMYERFGFKKEGILRDHVFRDGRYHDVVLYGLLADEFRKRSQSGRRSYKS